jgi:hypothetical protein
VKSNIIKTGGDDVATIKSKNGIDILVDDDKLEELNKFIWYVSPKGYAISNATKKRNGYIKANILMHRYLTNCPKGMTVDHINGNKLDNRLENLEVVTNHDNVSRYYVRKLYS